MNEPTFTLQLTQEQIEDIANDLALGGFATTLGLFLDAVPDEIRNQLYAQWNQDLDDPDQGWNLAGLEHYP